MDGVIRYGLVFWLGLAFSLSSAVFARDKVISLTEPEFELVTDGVFEQDLDFNNLPGHKVFDMTYWGSSPRAEIRYNGASLFKTSGQQAQQQVQVRLGQEAKTLTFNLQVQPARYEQDYIEAHKNKVSVQVPEVYELNHILLLLSDVYHHSEHRMHRNGQYYEEVIRWFSPYRQHKIFKQLGEVDYYAFIENAAAYAFDGSSIKKTGPYTGFRAKNTLGEHLALLEDFAKQSQFRRFYREHRHYYSELIDNFLKSVQPKQVWHWLELHFPQRHQSYKVFFSPLARGSHSARKYRTGNFNEAVIFISGPNRYDGEDEQASLASMKLSRSFFTEVDHTYVNPVSDLYLEQINEALAHLSPWYQGGGYNSPYLVFNEYMTWAVFSLFAQEHFSASDYRLIKSHIEIFMVQKRGFYRFKAFNDALIALYKDKGGKEKVSDLYPQIIHWVKHHS